MEDNKMIDPKDTSEEVKETSTEEAAADKTSEAAETTENAETAEAAETAAAAEASEKAEEAEAVIKEEVPQVEAPEFENVSFEAPVKAEVIDASKKPKKPKQKGMKIPYERRKMLYGYGFIALWFIGCIYFFIMPTITSLVYSFNDTQPSSGEMKMRFVGFQNYVNAFRQDTSYSTNLLQVLGNTALKTPLIIIFSIFIAVILNQKFRGRTFARAVFFLPVIIATGPVYDIITGNMNTGGYSGGSEQFNTLFETDLVDQLLTFLGIYNISDRLTSIISTVTSDIFNMIWNAGIQILLFLSALQNIPTSAKEAAQMEGATAWEYFWKITVPYISPMIMASLVYTVVDSFVDPTNPVMQQVVSKSSQWQHGYSAAMAWAYFAIVGVVLAIAVVIVNKFVYYEVD